jgi:hypothetical protein
MMTNRRLGLAVLIAICCSGCASSRGRIVQDFDFDWRFLKDDPAGAPAAQYDDSQWRSVQLPHDWSIEGPYSQQWASGTGFLPGGIGWYRKTFTLDKDGQGKIVTVEFDGVYNNSEVWINGRSLGRRPFGYIGFEYDLTPHVRFDAENVLAVRVDHSDFADSRWYTGSGIYRHVRLKLLEPVHIAPWGTYVTTPKVQDDAAQIKIETSVENQSGQTQSVSLVSAIYAPDGRLAARTVSRQAIQAGQTAVFEQAASVSEPWLWDIDSPNLYTLKTTVAINGRTADQTQTPFGIRAFRFDANEGFFLNGRNLKLKGMCLHHDAGIVGAAVPEKVWVRRLEAMKEIGCNAIRCSHNPPAPEFLDLCDRMGFLVMDEAFDEFTPSKNKWVEGWNKGTPSRAGYAQVFEEWAQRDIADMVRRDRNHPSIIMWSIGNEVDYANDPFSHPVLGADYKPQNPPAENLTRYGKRLVETVKRYDTARPTTAALANAPMSNAVGFADILDVAGYNYQEKYYAEHHAAYPARVIYGSENHASIEAWEAVEQNDYIAGQFVWTGFDYLGEAGAWPYRSWDRSPFDICGFKKPSAWLRQSLWTIEPLVYITCRPAPSGQGPRGRWRPASPNWKADAGQMMEVQAFTNCDEVQLLLNDRPLEIKPYTEAVQRTLVWRVPFEAGELKAIGRRGGQAVCESVLHTPGGPSRVELVCDAQTLAADGKDVCHLEFRVVDDAGTLVWEADNEVTLTLTGQASIIGIGSGDPTSHQPHQGNAYKVYQGRGLAILRAGTEAGTVTIEAKAENLQTARVILNIKK